MKKRLIGSLGSLLIFIGLTSAQPAGGAGLYSGTPQVWQKALKIQKKFNYVVLNLQGLKIAYFPLYVSLKAIENVRLHPLFPTIILFQNGWSVEKATVGFPVKQFDVYKNAVIIRPDFSFVKGGFTILLRKTDEDKEMLINFIAENTDNLKGEVYYPYVVVVDRNILSPAEVLEQYFLQLHSLPDKEVEFFINGITYFIKPVKQNGNVAYKDRKFLVGVKRIESGQGF